MNAGARFVCGLFLAFALGCAPKPEVVSVRVPAPATNAAPSSSPAAPDVRTAPDIRMALIAGATMSVRIDVHRLRESAWFQGLRRENDAFKTVEKLLDTPCGFPLLDSVEEIAGSHSGDQNVIVGVRLSRPLPDVGACLRGAAFEVDRSTIGDFNLYVRAGDDDTAVVVEDDVVFIGSPATLRLALLHRGPEDVGTGPLEPGEAMRLSMRATADFDALDGIVRAGPDEFALAGQATFYTAGEAEHAASFLGELNDQIRAEFARTTTGPKLPPNFEIVHVTREGLTLRLTAGFTAASDGHALEEAVRTMALHR